MKKVFFNCFVMCLMLVSYTGTAQVGINTTNPHPSAALDVTAVNGDKGLLMPRISTAARVSMIGMANSLLVFDTDLQLFFYYQTANARHLNYTTWH